MAASQQPAQNGLHGQQTRPLTSNSVYSQDVDEIESSWDSRSLGRDSALGPYMSAFRDQPRGAADDMFSTDRPNPFLQGNSYF